MQTLVLVVGLILGADSAESPEIEDTRNRFPYAPVGFHFRLHVWRSDAV
jgi:hypothetical protein